MKEQTYTTATFAGGCFWCIEAAFNQLHGVKQALSGYMGGVAPNPSYQQICTGTTGHAEVVEVTFDNTVISYEELLTMFFKLHDPTQLNRQGNDIGSQYRSAIFYHNEQQHQQAQKIIRSLNEANIWPSPLVTELPPASTFYCAESYHQNYVNNNPQNGYCQVLVLPKLEKFKAQYANKLKHNIKLN